MRYMKDTFVVMTKMMEMTTEKEKETKIGEYNIDEGDYEEFFQKAMKKFGIKSPEELDDEEKKNSSIM